MITSVRESRGAKLNQSTELGNYASHATGHDISSQQSGVISQQSLVAVSGGIYAYPGCT